MFTQLIGHKSINIKVNIGRKYSLISSVITYLFQFEHKHFC